MAKIKNEHLYHGAALTQIAAHPQFTAINSFKNTSGPSRSAFKINDGIGVYLKYATEPKEPFEEYIFSFNKWHLSELEEVATKSERVFLALVCTDISLRWNRRNRRRQDFALRQERRTSDAGPASLQDASLLLARSR